MSLLLTLWPLLLVLCSHPLDAQAWKRLCPGTEASCGGRGTGWWRWQCGGCRLRSGRLCSLWLRRPWTGDLRCYYNCSDVAAGILTVRRTHWHMVTADTHLLFRWINYNHTYNTYINKDVEDLKLISPAEREHWRTAGGGQLSWCQTGCCYSTTMNICSPLASLRMCVHVCVWHMCVVCFGASQASCHMWTWMVNWTGLLSFDWLFKNKAWGPGPQPLCEETGRYFFLKSQSDDPKEMQNNH